MTHTILFLAVFLCFNLWIATNGGKWGGRPWGSLSGIAFLCYLFGFLFGSFSLWQVFFDLILFIASSFVINIVTGRYLIAFPLIFGIAGIFYYFKEGSSVAAPVFPINENTILPMRLASEGEVFVVLKNDYNIASLEVTLKRFDIQNEPKKAFSMQRKDWTDLDDVYMLDLPDDKLRMLPRLLQALEHHAAVKAVEVNENIFLSPLDYNTDSLITDSLESTKIVLNDPLIAQQWAFTALDFTSFHEYIQSNKIRPQKKIRLAILDTGVDGNHEDLSDFMSAAQPEEALDVMGHGTHCAGIAAAVSNNEIGIASLIPNDKFIEIISLRVFDETGTTSQQRIVDAMLKAIDMNCQVISMSLGGPINTETQYIYGKAIEYAKKKGVIIVVAAGNENQDASQRAPAGLEGVITVAAVDKNLNKAGFSNDISKIKMPIAAPGVDIYSTLPNNTYNKMSGTSMATPYVAGLVAMLKSIKPNLTTEQIHNTLEKTALYIENNKVGCGIIQPYRALKYTHTGALK